MKLRYRHVTDDTQRLGMMTILGQYGQPQDYARGIRLIREAAEAADENAPQGTYVRSSSWNDFLIVANPPPGIRDVTCARIASSANSRNISTIQ